VNNVDLTDATLESWLTGAALDYDVPPGARQRILSAAGESTSAEGPLPAGVRRPPRVRVTYPRLVAAAVLVVASVGAASLWNDHGSGASTSARNGSATATTGSSPATRAHGTAVGKAALRAAPAAPGAANGDSTAAGSASSAGAASSAGSAAGVPAPAPNPDHSNKAQDTTATGAKAITGGTAGVADSAKIVHTGTLTLTVAKGKVSTTLTQLDSLAAGAEGYVASTKTTESGDLPSGNVVLRVPADSYDAVLAQARTLGTVDSQTSSGKDVTAQSADLSARMTSLKKVRENYLALLAKAKTIGETLSVQQHVDDNQADIDQLQGQINVLSDQASYGTLTVTVTQKALPAPLPKPRHHKSGLALAWDRAVNGFVTGVEALVARSGRAVLVLMVLLAGAVVLRMAWRVGRRRLV
jgi:hypothetical protein